MEKRGRGVKHKELRHVLKKKKKILLNSCTPFQVHV